MKKTKVFFDCEFTGLRQNTTLISIGLVTENNKTFYAEFTDYDESQVDDWLRHTVIDKLRLQSFNIDTDYHPYGDSVVIAGTRKDVGYALDHWLHRFEFVEIWSDCLAYDWILLCELFGGAYDVPNNVYYIPFDIRTLFKIKGIDPDIRREDFAEVSTVEHWGGIPRHNALCGACVLRACYIKATTSAEGGIKDTFADISTLSQQIHQANRDKGFYDEPREVGTCLMLIVSEVAEALEADRNGRYANLSLLDEMEREGYGWHNSQISFESSFRSDVKDSHEDEVADAIIRLLDYAGSRNMDIGKHIRHKLSYNSTRPHKHGKKY